MGIDKVLVKGSEFPSDHVAPKCSSEYKSVAKKKKIDLNATGEQKNNLMLNFLRCQSKATKNCKEMEKEYSLCHKSFMGVGSYKGKKHCGEELGDLWKCLRSDTRTES